jgi:hypothetical protein
VSGLSGIKAIAGGASHSLFLKNDGSVWAMGLNAYGQLGDGTIINSVTPIQVSGLSSISAIAGGANHSLFLKNDGTVLSTGYNYYGELGYYSLMDRTTSPLELSLFNVVISSYQWYIGGSSIGNANASTYAATTAGSYTVQVSNSNGCSSTSAAISVASIPNNTVSAASSAPTVYVNKAITNLTFNTTGATGMGTPTGLPAGVSATWANNTLTISGTPIATGTFNYSIPLMGGCGSISATGTLTVTFPCQNEVTLVSPSDDYVSGTYQKAASSSAGKITATNKLTGTSNVIYRAKAIELNPGFKAESGTVFLAEIGGCN